MDKRYKNRLDKLRDYMRRAELNGVIMNAPYNVSYYTGVHVPCCYFIVAEDKDPIILVLDSEKSVFFDAAEKAGLKDIRPLRIHDPVVPLAKAMKDVGLTSGKLGLEKFHLNALRVEMVTSQLPKNLKVENAEHILDSVRIIKDEDEIENCRQAAKLADLAMDTMVKMLEPGRKESEIALEGMYAAMKNGAGGCVQPVYVASGKRTCFAHCGATSKRIEANDVVNIDFLPKYNSYYADMARTIFMGQPTAEQEKNYRLFCDVFEKMVEMIRPGVALAEVRSTFYHSLKDAGLTNFQFDEVFHGVGRMFLEKPSFAWPYLNGYPELVEANSVIAFTNTGVYFGDFGFRLEDTLLVKEDGNEFLTTYPKSLICVP